MEDGQGHGGALGVGHGLSSRPRNPLEPTGMQRFSENGARPVLTLGGLNPQPLGRLGALVFHPHNSEPLYWSSLWAPTRIAGCALGHRPHDTRWENVPSENRWASSLDPLSLRGRTTPLLPRGNTGRRTHHRTISFSLWTVFAEHAPKTPGRSSGSSRERMHP
jgi:hypothetical protein